MAIEPNAKARGKSRLLSFKSFEIFVATIHPSKAKAIAINALNGAPPSVTLVLIVDNDSGDEKNKLPTTPHYN